MPTMNGSGRRGPARTSQVNSGVGLDVKFLDGPVNVGELQRQRDEAADPGEQKDQWPEWKGSTVCSAMPPIALARSTCAARSAAGCRPPASARLR